MSGTNPITAWIKSGMETYKGREDWMVERVSECSINAQKTHDERHGPFIPHNAWQQELKCSVNFRPAAAISSYAGQEAGNAGSFRAMRYYQKGWAERRDEILTDIAKNGE
ncbi:hypothetical protein ACHAXR_012837 [Thalassiosira sp. AJA248-18]